MTKLFRDWYNRYLTDPDTVVLLLFLAVIILVIALFGQILKPVFVSIVIAYLLGGLITRLESHKCPHALAVTVVFLIFIGAFIFICVGILPLLWREAANLLQNAPSMLNQGKQFFSHLPERYPGVITSDQIKYLTNNFQSFGASLGHQALSYSLTTLSSVITIILYFVLVPFLVFFMLLDRDQIILWFSNFLPRHRRSINQVWSEVNEQFAFYIRGRGFQIILLSIVSYIAFLSLGLNYALLLAVVAAVSIIIPYIGPIVATIPIVLIGFLQWGWSSHFIYLIVIYFTIFTLSGSVLEPILFSEALDLHPVTIIVALLFFGETLGFWGVFFAIPLACVVRAILNTLSRSG